MINFLSCDWGTTSFRLRLIDAQSQATRAEVLSSQGIAATHQDWLKQGLPENERLDYYRLFLRTQMHKLEKKWNHSLNAMPLLISGMASSSIGMMALDYLPMPFHCDAADIRTKLIEPSESFPNPLILVSGAQTAHDVMRGEETLLIGCDTDSSIPEQYFIFPGTHSKHILVKNGMAVDLKTFMTGEIFELLVCNSILSASLPENIPMEAAPNSLHFKQGVKKGRNSNLLNAVFNVRTNQLFKQLTPDENYLYLSGLLIGYELSALKHVADDPVVLVCGANLKEYYRAALVSGGFKLQVVDADQAFIRGHCRIAAQILNSSFSPHKS
jgi:2-dehydro-3-deoxygalactonokinase